VRCVPGRFDSRLRAYLDRWNLALSFAVGRWHFRVVRHATRCARLWLAWWRTAAIGRVGVEMGPEGRIRGSVASSNQKTNEAEGRRGRASNDGGRGEGRGDRRVYGPALLSVVSGGRRASTSGGRDGTSPFLLRANSAFPRILGVLESSRC
jgi:hypothetical protein